MSCQKYRNAFWVFQMKIESYGNRELMHIIKLTAPHDVMISHPEEVAKILLEN